MGESLKYLVTGGAGFVGSHLVRHLLANTDADLILPVSFSHKGNADRLIVAIDDHPEWWDRVEIMYHDLLAPFSNTQIARLEGSDVIFNVASESHVDRSITGPVRFVQNNVALVLNMLELARIIEPSKFIQVSTDEVYGPAPGDTVHEEWSPIIPSNPYSASKAAQEAIAISYWRTYQVPVIITNTMNIIGETQDPEKFVPKTIRSALKNDPITVHTDEKGNPGSRFYLHARNQADALLFIANQVPVLRYPQHDRPERLNVVGEVEVNNREMAEAIKKYLKSNSVITSENFHKSRPGHDLRYGLDGTKLANFGWKAPVSFWDSLYRTIDWTLLRSEWLM